MSELVPVPDDLQATANLLATTTRFTVALTGQVVDLSDPADVARTWTDIREAERQLAEIKGLLRDVLRLEASRQGTKTLHVDEETTVTVKGGPKREWDYECLAATLRSAGLPEPRLADLIVETVSYRVDGRVANQLRAANPEYGAALDACSSEIPGRWDVSIQRKGRP